MTCFALTSLPEALGAASTEDLLPLASVAGPSLEQEANSQPATAATSQNTTPRDTPPSTPGLARRMSGVPALKLNLDDTTWSTVRPPKAVGATHLAQRKEEPKRSGLANKVRDCVWQCFSASSLVFGDGQCLLCSGSMVKTIMWPFD